MTHIDPPTGPFMDSCECSIEREQESGWLKSRRDGKSKELIEKLTCWLKTSLKS